MSYKQIKQILTSKRILKKASYYVCLYYFPYTTFIIKTTYDLIK